MSLSLTVIERCRDLKGKLVVRYGGNLKQAAIVEVEPDAMRSDKRFWVLVFRVNVEEIELRIFPNIGQADEYAQEVTKPESKAKIEKCMCMNCQEAERDLREILQRFENR